MKKHFYSHLVSFEHVKVELSDANLTPKEQAELMDLAEKQLHHVMLDTALTHIKGVDKEIFLYHLHKDEHDKAWSVLRKHTKDIEAHLLHAAHTLYETLRNDIKEISHS